MLEYISIIADTHTKEVLGRCPRPYADYKTAWEQGVLLLDNGEWEWEDNPTLVIIHRYTFALCEGRHEMPVAESLFPSTLDPTDVEGMAAMADAAIPKDCDDLHIYVTGLTAAMLAVVAVCERRQIPLTAHHYDRNTGKYFPQRVLSTTIEKGVY